MWIFLQIISTWTHCIVSFENCMNISEIFDGMLEQHEFMRSLFVQSKKIV